MEVAERWWAIGAGLVGLGAFAGGWLLMALPRVDTSDEVAIATVVERRSSILRGSLLAVSGSALLLWPLAAVNAAAGNQAWISLRVFSITVWVLAFGLLSVSAITAAALAWRDPRALAPSSARLFLDASHLATWSVSAPLAIVAVVATTAVGVQAGFFGVWVICGAGVKAVTAAVEVVGVGRREGWNAGGWAAGASGYATVVWFALVLGSLPAYS